MTVRRFDIIETDECLTSHSGLAMVGLLMERSGIRARLAEVLPRMKAGSVHSADAVVAMAGLLSMAKPDFAAIEGFRQDEFFRDALGLGHVPSEATLRQRLDRMGLSIRDAILESSADLLRKTEAPLTACFGEYVPIDGDVSPFDNSGSKKEGVSCTYKMVEGYAPMFAYLGEEGYLLNAELRAGSQHCQKGTPQFLRQTIALARKVTDSPLLLRMDSGNDDSENMRICDKAGVAYVIKRNIRRESVAEWLETAQAYGQWRIPREGKEVYVGDTWVQREGKAVRVVFQVTKQTIDEVGQVLLMPEIEVETYFTSLTRRAASAEDVIGLYHGHGTCEQFHSELKSDMDLERLPSGKFATNALILTIATLIFNVLRLCGQTALKLGHAPRKAVQRRRIRTVIQDIVYMAARIVNHARRLAIAFSRCNPLRGVWAQTYHLLGSTA